MFGNPGLWIAQSTADVPWLCWADCPLMCQDPKSITCQTYHMHAASVSMGTFMSGKETPNRNGATPACPSSALGFLHSNALWAFCSKQRPSLLAASQELCLAPEAEPWVGSSLQQPAGAGPAWCQLRGRGCRSRMPRHGAMADVLGSLPCQSFMFPRAGAG